MHNRQQLGCPFHSEAFLLTCPAPSQSAQRAFLIHQRSGRIHASLSLSSSASSFVFLFIHHFRSLISASSSQLAAFVTLILCSTDRFSLPKPTEHHIPIMKLFHASIAALALGTVASAQSEGKSRLTVFVFLCFMPYKDLISNIHYRCSRYSAWSCYFNCLYHFGIHYCQLPSIADQLPSIIYQHRHRDFSCLYYCLSSRAN